MNLGQLLNAASGALTAGNVTEAGSLIGQATTAFGASQTTVNQANGILGDIKDALKSTPPDKDELRESINALRAMEGQLPTVDAAQIQLLDDLGTSNVPESLSVVATIAGSLATHAFA